VILDQANHAAWLNDTPSAAKALLQPYPADEMLAYPVSTKVNSPKNEAADLVEPIGTD
jgi:putative SOS response-associated peptidase YedK